MKTSDFFYELPQELIAQDPLEDRSASRLMHLSLEDGRIEHRHFREVLEYLNPGDCLVINDTKVIPAVAEYDAAGTAEVKDAAASLAAAKERSVAMEKKLNVEGMMCDHCVAHVTKALEGVPGVSSVKVSLADKDAVVEASPEVTDEALVSAVKEAGYEATVA